MITNRQLATTDQLEEVLKNMLMIEKIKKYMPNASIFYFFNFIDGHKYNACL